MGLVLTAHDIYFLLVMCDLLLAPFSPSSPFLIEGVLGSKNLFRESCLKCPITQGWTPFQTPSTILGAPGGHFGFCRPCGVAGGERVPPAPLGWYFSQFPLHPLFELNPQVMEKKAHSGTYGRCGENSFEGKLHQ